MSNLNTTQLRALTTYVNTAKRLGINELIPQNAVTTEAALQAFIEVAEPGFKATQSRLQTGLDYQKKNQEGVAHLSTQKSVWGDVDRSVDRIEELLKSPSTLKSRLDEGRRSMMPRISPRVAELVNVTLTETGNRYTAAIDPESLNNLKKELESWAQAWMTFTVQWISYDINRQIEYMWVQRNGSLAAEQPAISPLTVNKLSTTFHAPSLTGEKDKASLAGGVYRNFRTILYGVMSFTFLFGLRGSGGDTSFFTGLMVVAGIVAIIYGFLQAKRDQEKDGEALRAQLQEKAEREARDAVRIWLDRIADKMVQDIREQLHQRRTQLFSWYQTSVIPKRDDFHADVEKRKILASEAVGKIRHFETQIRDLQRVKQEFERLKNG